MNIKELAEQAGLAYKTPNGKYWIDAGYPDIHLERFADLVAEQTHTNNKAKWYQEGYEAGRHDEREACAGHYLGIMRDAVEQAVAKERECCAKLCNSLHDCEPEHSPDDCAAAIRARGEK